MRVDLLRTKLFPPRRRSGLVARERLRDHLKRGYRDARLVLVDAPPGWGKTSVLADWLATDGAPPSGWVSLDGDDNDPIRFWTYAVAALQDIVPDAATAAFERLQIHGIDPARDIVPDLINELTDVPTDVVLALDDYHVIRSTAVHKSLAEFVEQAPPQVHVAMATRNDPPFSLARMRARGELLELRAAQLRFTADESVLLLDESLRLSLDPDDVERLVERTEGWVAGLQLAALTLQDRADASEFIAKFAGDDRHIVDYLGTEVLDGQPEEIREFLLTTSILERMCAPLCAAVTGSDDAVELLAAVDHGNLFLVALDNAREWFRYHHLFGELLRHELRRQHPERVADLHRRAAAWPGQEPASAIAHAQAAGDDALVVRVVRDNWQTTFNIGQLSTVDRWLDLVPAKETARDPDLALARVWVALDEARLDDAAIAIRRAAGAGVDADHIRILEALLAFKEGDLAHAGATAAGVTEPHDPFWAAVVGCLRGLVAFWSGETTGALLALEHATRIAERSDNPLATVYTLGYRALALAATAPDQARALLDEARPLIDVESVGGHFVTFAAALAGHRLAAAGDAADLAASRAADLARRGAGRIELAATLFAAGDASAGDDVLATCADPGPVVRTMARTHSTPPKPRRRRSPMVEHLTEREQMILRLLTGTGTNREIAAALFVSPNTLKTHLRAIYRKVDASDRHDAITRGRELGLL